MRHLLSNLRLTQKLALLGILTFVMVIIPAYRTLSADLASLRQAERGMFALPPLAALRKSMHLTQLHRGQSLAVLAGNQAMAEARRKTRQDLDAALAEMATAVSVIEADDVSTRATTVRQRWQQLAGGVDGGKLSADQALAEHASLVAAQMELSEVVANATGLVLLPDADGYFLQSLLVSKLEPMIDSLGMLRGLGTAALQQKELQAQDQGRARAQLLILHNQHQAKELTLQAAMNALRQGRSPEAAAVESAASAAGSEVKNALSLVERALLASTKPGQGSEDYFKAMTVVIDAQIALGETLQSATTAVLTNHHAAARQHLLINAVLLLLLGSTGGWILWSLAGSLRRSMGAALTVVEAVAGGDLSVQASAEGKDEFARLLQAMQRMTQQLQGLIHGVRSGAEGVATASAQIAAGNMSLSQRTEQQAASLEETASSMEELTATVRQNADNARQANQLAMNASEVAVRGGEVVRDVVTTMQGISASSKKIADIIGVIDGIAFQTNILALNAAVEAARAGEQGRGFAVVASEVRSLAQRSADAAKEINHLITGSATEVEAGTRFVNQAGHTMEEIVSSVKSVTDIMAEIATASQEQSCGIDQINRAISSMDEVTQQNAALVEEAAAAAGTLQEQAAALVQAAAGFKLRKDAVGHGSPRSPAQHAQLSPPSPPSSQAVMTGAGAMAERRGPERAKNVARLPAAKLRAYAGKPS